MSTRPVRPIGPATWHSLAAPQTYPVFWTSTDDAMASAHTLPTPVLSLVFGGKTHGDLKLVRAEPARQIARLQPGVPLAAPSEPTDDLVDLPGDLPSDQSVDAPGEQPVNDAVDRSADLSADPPLDLSSDHRVDHLMDQAVDRAVDDPAADERPSDPPFEPPSDLSVECPIERSNPPPRHPNGIELTIDSLPNHLLVEPIPVAIEPLDDGTYTASVHTLNTSAGGHSIVEALLLLKERVEAVYEGLNNREELTADERLTLQMMHTYIAAKKPEWV